MGAYELSGGRHNPGRTGWEIWDWFWYWASDRTQGIKELKGALVWVNVGLSVTMVGTLSWPKVAEQPSARAQVPGSTPGKALLLTAPARTDPESRKAKGRVCLSCSP